jgi:hypothetical protein
MPPYFMSLVIETVCFGNLGEGIGWGKGQLYSAKKVFLGTGTPIR